MFKGSLKADSLFKRVLAIGAHPDDIELGCFGTLLRFQRSGSKIALCVLSHGECGVNPTNRCAEARASAKLVQGDLTLAGLPDTQILEGQPTIRLIEEVIEGFEPTAVFVNSPNDTHQDHRNVSRAAVSAARLVPSLFLYQTPSSTRTFTPQVFVDISSVIKDKVHAITIHKSQAKHSYMADRAVKGLAEFLGLQIYRGGKYFEGFEVHQIVL
jgi:LmbE family N-acetylglucosaminyl deacetylase